MRAWPRFWAKLELPISRKAINRKPFAITAVRSQPRSSSVSCRKRQGGPVTSQQRWSRTRDWDGAEAALEQALALKPEPRSRAFLDLNAAAVARGRGRLDQARSIYETTLIASAAMPVVAWQAHFGLALVWSELKQTRKADQHFEAALRLIEENQSSLSRSEHKITFLGRLISFYQAYVNTLMVRGDPVAALSVADSSRARIMAERFSLPSSPRNSELPRRLPTYGKRLRKYLAFLLAWSAAIFSLGRHRIGDPFVRFAARRRDHKTRRGIPGLYRGIDARSDGERIRRGTETIRADSSRRLLP